MPQREKEAIVPRGAQFNGDQWDMTEIRNIGRSGMFIETANAAAICAWETYLVIHARVAVARRAK